MIEILSMSAGHCNQVAQLHQSSLSTPFKGISGEKLLEIYYRSLVEAEGAVGYVACKQGEVTGYVCGIWDRSLIKRRLFIFHGLGLLVWGTFQLLDNPRIWVDLLRRIFGKSVGISATDGIYELRPIVVAPAARGSGVADQLLVVLLEDALQRGHSSVYLFTERTNLAANSFYRRSGFNQVVVAHGLPDTYLYYGISTLRNALDHEGMA